MLTDKWLTGKTLDPEVFKPFIIPAIVLLVGISAFALGRISALASPATAPAATATQP